MMQPGEKFKRMRSPQLTQVPSHGTHFARFNEACSVTEDRILRRIDECEQAVLAKMDACFRRTMIWIGLVFLATVGNIVKDLLR